MEAAARYNRPHLIDIFIKKGASDWTRSMCGAIEGGHMDLVIFFMAKDVNKAQRAKHGFLKACWENKLGFVQYFVDEAEKLNPINKRDLCNGLYNAALKGHINVVKNMLERGADDCESALSVAKQNRHDAIVALLSPLVRLS
jgi:hypothetical protein